MNRVLTGVILLLWAAALGGCGESFAELSGKVTFKDKPMPGGTVVFVTEDGSKTEQVPIQKDGTYSSKKVPYGNLRVGVVPPPRSGASFMPKGVEMPANNPNAATVSGGETVDIPANLQDPAKSNITVKVDGSQKTFDIPLKG